MKLIIRSLISTVEPLKFWNGEVILSWLARDYISMLGSKFIHESVLAKKGPFCPYDYHSYIMIIQQSKTWLKHIKNE